MSCLKDQTVNLADVNTASVLRWGQRGVTGSRTPDAQGARRGRGHSAATRRINSERWEEFSGTPPAFQMASSSPRPLLLADVRPPAPLGHKEAL